MAYQSATIAKSVTMPALIATVALIRRRRDRWTRSLAAASSLRSSAASAVIRSVRYFPFDCSVYASREFGFLRSGRLTSSSHF